MPSVSLGPKALFCSVGHTSLLGADPSSRGQGWRLCSSPESWPTHRCHLYTHMLLASPFIPHSAPMPAAAQGPWGHFISLCVLAPRRHRCLDESGAWAKPHLTGSVGSRGFELQAAAERLRRLEASPATTGLGSRFLCASAPNQSEEEAWGPSSGSHSGEDFQEPPGAMGCQAGHHDNSCSCEATEVGAVEKPLPMQMLPWREEASWAACPPTLLCHPIPLFTKAETIHQALTEKETG